MQVDTKSLRNSFYVFQQNKFEPLEKVAISRRQKTLNPRPYRVKS